VTAPLGEIAGFSCLIPEGPFRAGFPAAGCHALGKRAAARYAGRYGDPLPEP